MTKTTAQSGDARAVTFPSLTAADKQMPAWGAPRERGIRAWMPEPFLVDVTPPPEAAPPAADPAVETAPPAPAPVQPVDPKAGWLPPEEVERLLAEQHATLEATWREPMVAAGRDLAEAAFDLNQRAHEDLVDMAVRLASALVKRSLEVDRELLLEHAKRALRMAGPVQRIVVRCSPADTEALREALPEMAREEAGGSVEVIVRASDDIDAGLLVTFDQGIVDARVDKGLERLAEAARAAISEAPLTPAPVEPEGGE